MWGTGRPPDPWPWAGVGAEPWVLGGGEGGLREAAPGCSLCSALPSARPQLPNQSELRAPTAEKAALYLDAALAARSARRPGCSSHLLFTLHVYQYRVEKCGRGGSRCRLGTPLAPHPPRGAWRGPLVPGAPGLHRHLPALCFQCPEAAAACISSTWAAVRGHPAGAGRPPGDPPVCLCRPWAVSSWPWSVEPSMCPTGEWCALWWAVAGVAPGEPAKGMAGTSSVPGPLSSVGLCPPHPLGSLPEGSWGVLAPRAGCQS